jgi:hypothetical protein
MYGQQDIKLPSISIGSDHVHLNVKMTSCLAKYHKMISMGEWWHSSTQFTYSVIMILLIMKSYKGKAFQLLALTGPEGSKRLKLPDFKTVGT